MHLWRRLGIARPNKFVGLCTRLAQTFVFSELVNKQTSKRDWLLIEILYRNTYLSCLLGGVSQAPLLV